MNRVNLGSNPEGTPSQPITILTNTGAVGVSGLTDFRIFKEGNQWFAFLIYQTGDVVVRLNFGTDITNTAPTFSLINLPGFLEKPRGIDLFEDRGRKYAVLANQNNGTLTLLQFGSTYRNVPIPSTIEVPTAVNLFKVSMIRDCNIWHAFVSDQAQDSVFHLIFQRGLNGVPTRKMIGMIDAIGLKAVKDGDRFYLFATKTQPTKFNVYKFSFGNSLDQEPATDSLGTFPVTTPASGIQRVYGMEIYKNALSEHFFFGLGTDNSLMYRLKFQNPCSADFPTAQGDTVFNQAYRADGKYYFSYTGLNRAGEQVSGFDSVTVQNLVDADFIIPGNRCKGESILFNDASITGPLTSITSWHWDFADSLATVDTSTLANPTHIFSKAGIYLVRLRVQEQGGCINEIVKSVVVADKPKPAFNVVSNGSLCTNDSIEFSDATVTINDPIVSHLWEVRQNGNLIASSTRQNPRFYFTQTGTYQINLQVKGESQCDSTISRPITIESVGSQVSFSSPTACLGEAVTFVPNITGPAPDSIRWFIDAAGYNVGSGNFTHTFNLNSVFSVRLTVYNQSCANTFTRIVRVNTRPNFSVNAQAPLPCEGLPITFGSNLNTTDPVNYLWEFGDGTTDSVSSPTKIFNSAGTFKVKLLVSTDNGCAGTDSLDFIAKRSPKALFSFDKACKDEPVTFTNLSTANGIPGGITSYFWEFGTITGLTSTAQDPGQILYNEPPGIKIVRLTVRTQEDCPSTYTKEIAIGPKIAANFRKESGCLGTPFRFYDMTAAGVDSIRKWNWSVGGLNYTSQNPIVELSQLGTYDVRLRVESKSGCVDEVTRTAEITVLDSARADFSISGTFNSPPFIAVFRQLPQENPSYSYEWDFGDSTSSSSPNPPPHIYNTEGTYVVTMVATRRETICSTRVQKAVNVISNPLQGIKIRRITVAKGSERISMSAEVENQSNIALRTFRLNFRAGNLLTGSEDWNGIFMPGAIIQVPLQTDLLVKSSQKIPFVCLTASLPDPGKELSPGDNSQCLSLDSFPSLSTMFPNPAANELTVEMSLSSGDPVEIRITNMLGQEFARFESDGLGAGPFRKTFDMRDIPSGMYSVWFRTGTHSESKKLMVLRP
jgi:PKD repeat protein